MRRNCNCWREGSSNKKCNKPFFMKLRVKVFHPNSLRHSWQTWYMCKSCYNKFKETNGKEWGCSYRNDVKPFAPLVEYEII